MSVLRSALAAALLMAAAPAAAETVKLRADSWCPYNCEPGKAPGYLVEIVKAAVEPAGMTVDYQLMDWTEAIETVGKGGATGAVGAIEEEAPNLLYPKANLGRSAPVLATAKGSGFRFEGFKSLEGRRLGYVEDYFYSTEVNAFIDKHKGSPNLVTVSGDNVTDALIKLLLDGKVDAIVEDGNVIDFTIETRGYARLFEYHSMGAPSPVSIGFSPVDPAGAKAVALIDAELPKMRKDGRLAAILKKYAVKDWQE